MAYKVKYSRKEKKELKKNKPDKSLNQNNEKHPGNWIDAREEYVFI
jgi:hypothetical protein